MDEEEATEKGVISVTPDSNNPKGAGARRNSTGKANTRDSPSLSKSDEKLPPHYLRASTGSCHDFCKYGRKHAFEVKRRRPVLPTFLGNYETLDKDGNRVKVPALRHRRKRPELKLKQPKTELSDGVKVAELKDPSSQANWDEGSSEEPVVIKLMVSSPCIASYEHTEADRGGDHEELLPVKLDTWTEGPPEEPISVKLMTPSCIQKDIVEAEGSSEKPISMKLKTPSPIVRAERSSGLSKSKKANNPSPVHNSAESAKRRPVRLSGKSSHSPVNGAEELSKEQNQMRSLGISNRKKRQVTTPNTTQRPKAEISNRPKVIKQKEFDVSGQPYLIKHRTPPPLIKKTITSIELKHTDHEQKKPSSAKPVNSLKASSPSKRIYVSAKPVISLKPKTSVVNFKSPLISSGGRTVLRKQQSRIIRSASLSETGENKVLKPSKASLSLKAPVNGVLSTKPRKYGNTKPASPVKYQATVGKGRHNTEFVEEKTLYVIQPKLYSVDLKPVKQRSRKYKSSLPLPSSLSSSSDDKYKREDSVSAFRAASKSNLEKCKKAVDASKGDNKRRQVKSATTGPEDKLPSPHKLNFRRGKVVNFQPEISAPRRLKFRQARAASTTQNGKGEGGRRSFKKREVSGDYLNPPTSEAPVVVLRHQDVQDKKDTQGLFNLVIEETASKLVETRKSKVMALVGAFETVISLQER